MVYICMIRVIHSSPLINIHSLRGSGMQNHLSFSITRQFSYLAGAKSTISTCTDYYALFPLTWPRLLSNDTSGYVRPLRLLRQFSYVGHAKKS